MSEINFTNPSPAEQDLILNMPAMSPPGGVASNFVDPPNNNKLGITVTAVCLSLEAVIFLVRVYAKVFVQKKIRIEDAVGLLSFGASIAHAWSIIAIANSTGLFVHQWNIQIREMQVYVPLLNLLRTFYFLTICFAKNAILLEWIHIFVPWPHRNWFFWLCSGVILVNTLLYIAAIILTFVVCIPAEAVYLPWVQGTCLNQKVADCIVMAFNLATDLLILLAPQKVIWGLNLTSRRKYGISVIFSLGILTCVCAIGRVYTTITLDYEGDALYWVCPLFLWGVGEATCLSMVFSVPAVPKALVGESGLVNKLVQSFRSLTSSQSKVSGDLSEGSKSGWRRIKPGVGPNDTSLYRQMDHSDVPLEPLSSRDGQAHCGNEDRIIMTNEVTVEEGIAIQNPQDQRINRQHPWMEDSRYT